MSTIKMVDAGVSAGIATVQATCVRLRDDVARFRHDSRQISEVNDGRSWAQVDRHADVVERTKLAMLGTLEELCTFINNAAGEMGETDRALSRSITGQLGAGVAAIARSVVP